MFTVTYAPDFQIVLTRRCAFSCGYCNFPRTPSPIPPSKKVLRRLLRTATRLGASQITLTAGEGIGETDEIVSVSRYYGFENWWAYLRAMCSVILQARLPRVLMPVLNVGALPISELRLSREVVPVVRLMLHSGDERLMETMVHGLAPQKDPARRVAALEELGRWKIPVTTGIMVGIGETPESWIRTAKVVSGLHRRHGHIQNFVIEPFVPLPHSAMALQAPTADGTLIRAVRDIRHVLDPEIPITVELQDRLHLAAAAIRAGASDFGALRVGSSERIEFDVLAALEDARQSLAGFGVLLQERSALLDSFAEGRKLPRAIWESQMLYRQTRPQPDFSPGIQACG